jgi:hypothetical protein
MATVKDWILKANNNAAAGVESEDGQKGEKREPGNMKGSASKKVRGTDDKDFVDGDKSDDKDSGDEERNKKVVGKKAKKAPVQKKGKVDGLTVEQHRRSMGDLLKAKIEVLGGQQWGIGARCHVTTTCSLAVFRALVVPNATKVSPEQFDQQTDVVLAQVSSTEQVSVNTIICFSTDNFFWQH